ncbi:MAG TPA: hypothetical protein VMU31_10720 [Rhizomicrobium sp.]|nr:hypothetical protein [Rhizomicrobium sp.]
MTKRDDYVSIIGPSMDAVMQAFRDQHLGEQSYAILNPVAQHRYVVAGGAKTDEGLEESLNGQRMFTAVFVRRGDAR